MVTFIEHNKENCKNRIAFNCDKANTNCKLCDFFEISNEWAASNASSSLLATDKFWETKTSISDYEFIYKEVKEVEKEMDEIRKMIMGMKQ